MRKEVLAFAGLLILTAAGAELLPGYLDMPAGVVEERMMLAMLPLLLVLVWFI